MFMYTCDWVIFVCFPNAMELAWHQGIVVCVCGSGIRQHSTICLRFHIRMCLAKRYVPCNIFANIFRFRNEPTTYWVIQLCRSHFFLSSDANAKYNAHEDILNRGQLYCVRSVYAIFWCCGIVLWLMAWGWNVNVFDDFQVIPGKFEVNRPFYWKMEQWQWY